MSIIEDSVFQHMANLSLWFKLRAGDSLTLADIPEVIPLRWTYFRDNWAVIRSAVEANKKRTNDLDRLVTAIEEMEAFIIRFRTATTDTNPFLRSNVFYSFLPVFDLIFIEDIAVTNQEWTLITNKRKTVRNFSRNDFLNIKQDLSKCRDQLADFIGLQDPTYDNIFNRGGQKGQVEAALSDIDLMALIQSQIEAVNFILANLFAVDAVIDPFALAKANANNPEVDIGQYGSGYLVKLHYGDDLRSLAERHLGDSNKWIDIAIANGLKEPYIDEYGEELFLLSNGQGNKINIPATSNNSPNIGKVFVGQMIFIQSSSLPFPSQRYVAGVKEVPLSGEIILTLDGEENLDLFQLKDKASIRVFKPNTVNSSQFVLIPSTVPLDDIRHDDTPWFQASSEIDEKKAKIDIAIGEDGSLQFMSNGDVSLSYGLANAIQAVKLKLSTEIGSNIFHKDYGIINVVGLKDNDETTIKNALVSSITTQIQDDPRFDRVESLNVTKSEPPQVAYYIDLVVRLAGSEATIPISFTVHS